jgi:flagellar biosynthesis protein FliQ
MTPDGVAQIVREALMVAFWLSVPLLLVAFVAGVIVSLLQIVTSIQDSAFNAVPRLVCVLAAALVAMPWMLKKAMIYATSILGNLSRYAG